jgi:hypothetical protein
MQSIFVNVTLRNDESGSGRDDVKCDRYILKYRTIDEQNPHLYTYSKESTINI